MPGKPPSKTFTLLALSCASVLLCGCIQKMNVEPKYEPYAASTLFADGASVRVPVEGTVARDWEGPDAPGQTGRRNGMWVDGFPFAITAERMNRGRENFTVFCSPCHGALGDGNGMIVRRGLHGPVSFHQPRFRAYPTGYFFEVITNGRGAMYPYGSRIPAEERWEIIAYLRALQLSQYAPASLIPPDQREQLSAMESP